LQGARVASYDCAQELRRSGSEDEDRLSHGKAAKHEALRLFVRDGQVRMEKVEEAVLCVGPGLAVHICDVLVQRKKKRAVGNDAARWLYSGLYRGRFC